MSDVALELCAHPGCEDFGVFPGVDDGGRPVKRCFVHDPGLPEPTDDDLRAIEAEPAGWSDEVVSGLAGIILDHAAMSLDDTPDAVEAAMRSLAEATNMPLDFAAGIVLAVSTLATVGEVLPEELSTLADMFEAQAEDAPVPLVPTSPDDEVCRWCDSPDHTTEDHERMYPQPWGHDDPPDDPDKCDGEHAGPACAAPDCWHIFGELTPGPDDDDDDQGDDETDNDQGSNDDQDN